MRRILLRCRPPAESELPWRVPAHGPRTSPAVGKAGSSLIYYRITILFERRCEPNLPLLPWPLLPSARGIFSIWESPFRQRAPLAGLTSSWCTAASFSRTPPENVVPFRNDPASKRKLCQSLTLCPTRAIVAGNAGSPQQLRHGDAADYNRHRDKHIHATSGRAGSVTHQQSSSS